MDVVKLLAGRNGRRYIREERRLTTVRIAEEEDGYCGGVVHQLMRLGLVLVKLSSIRYSIVT